METTAGDMERLPADLLAAVISLTSPADACRAAAVSRTFRAAVDSDAVWSHFLPRDLPQFDEFKLAPTPLSKKALFHRLCDKPAELLCNYISMQLDRATGDMCYMLTKVPEISPEEIEMETEDETREDCQWISLGGDDIARNKRFESFQSAFWTN